jgi:predicted Zn finger-like uncharacterized protein
MNITCPNCGFGRTVNEAKLPAKAVMATCPKCQHRFKFRELPDQQVEFEAARRETPDPAPAAMEGTGTAPGDTPVPAAKAPSPETPVKQAPAGPEARQHQASREDDLWKELEALNDDADDAPGSDGQGHGPTVLPLWERATSGYPLAFANTFMQVLANPRGFFSAMPVGHGIMKPLLFFLVIVQIVALSQSIWQLLGIMPPSLLTEGLGHTAQAALALILYPLEVSVFLFMDTAINHFFLRLFKADTKGFEGTFRAEAYSAAPMLLMVIPYIGMPLAMIGATVYKFLGLRHVHGASNKQVLAVLVLPMLLALAVAIVLTLFTGKI